MLLSRMGFAAVRWRYDLHQSHPHNRRNKPLNGPLHLPHSTDGGGVVSDIKAGDVVRCVTLRACDSILPITSLRIGGIYRVTSVFPSWRGSGLALRLEGITADTISGGFGSWRFRKIDAPKSEIAQRIKACRPKRVPSELERSQIYERLISGDRP